MGFTKSECRKMELPGGPKIACTRNTIAASLDESLEQHLLAAADDIATLPHLLLLQQLTSPHLPQDNLYRCSNAK